MVDADTGEIVAKANDELTEALLKKLRAAGIKEMQCLYTNELNQGAYISQTLASDETADQLAARVAIYRMMRPGEPPTEDAVEALFHRLFYSAGHLRPEPCRPHEVQRPRRPRRARRHDDAEQRRHPRRREDPGRSAQRQRRRRRHRPPGQPPRALRRRAGREPVPLGPGAHREGGEGAPRPGRDRSADAARPDQLQADLRGAEGVLRREPAQPVHGPDQPAVARSRTSGASRPWARAA